MMFSFLGKIVARAGIVVILVWIAVLVVAQLMAPPWGDVAEDKEFGFLPVRSPSRVAEAEFAKAFPDEPLGSNIVLVLTTEAGAAEAKKVREFIDDTLEPELRKIAVATGGLASEPAVDESDPFATPAEQTGRKALVSRIRTPNAPGVGALLESEDGKAMLVVMELTNEFLSSENWPVITRVEELVASLAQESKVPAGTEIVVTGSAVLGRDHTYAALQSARATEWLTVVMVICLLIIIYRAPLLAAIPLATVYVSVRLSLNLLSILAVHGYVTLFQGIQVYITVLAYGAGVDYCLFLMARYKEELDRGATTEEAVSHSVGRVGAALAASAATVVCGIGMLIFAEFGKFKQAGIAIPFALLITLCATLTFSAALLRIAGRWAFWPQVRGEAEGARPASASSFFRRFWKPGGFDRGWEWVARRILIHPGKVWVFTTAVMLPFAIFGGVFAGRLAYDVVTNLPASSPSVRGVQVLKEHFPQGILGPVTILLVNDRMDFASEQGHEQIEKLTDALRARQTELNLADIRTLTSPLGITPAAKRGVADLDVPEATRTKALRREAIEHYTTALDGRKRIGTRIEIVLHKDPFAVAAIKYLDQLENELAGSLPDSLREGSRWNVLGVTASIRDLANVQASDHTRISILVLAAVFVILMLLLRQAVLSFYMVLSVLYSYYVTFGVTYLFFWALDPHGFVGLDWKVSTFLFTILIAVGEDYNIFLMSRVHEEQRQRGRFGGILHAMIRTGPIISSCGIIMAGTFASLAAGSLSEMRQLGFALAFGVLVDTFVVRPVLVPSFLVLLEKFKHRHRRGNGKPNRPETAMSDDEFETRGVP
jgi:RND superfamily putative drug exporter